MPEAVSGGSVHAQFVSVEDVSLYAWDAAAAGDSEAALSIAAVFATWIAVAMVGTIVVIESDSE